MQVKLLWRTCFLICAISLMLTACVKPPPPPPQEVINDNDYPYSANYNEDKYVERLPQHIDMGHEKVILVDPKIFAWGAYDANGNLVRGGIATAGADFCPDDNAPCRTDVGTYRLYSLGNEDCYSRIYPRGKGGSLMPYCMFFNKGESLHGSPDHMLVEANISHGCVHIRIPDAEWLRKDFARVGTKVVILPY